MDGDGFEVILRRIVKEEVLAGLVTPRHAASELITDPSSGELSMSRLAMGALIFGVLAIDLGALYLLLAGRFDKDWFAPLGTMNTAALASVAAVYSLNSAAGALGSAKERVLGKLWELLGVKKAEELEHKKAIKIP